MIGLAARLLVGALCTLPASGLCGAVAADPAMVTAIKMGRGVNILGYDGIWSGASDAPFRLGDFKLIRKAGFGHVRINLFGFKYLGADNRLDPVMLERLDSVLDQAVSAGLVPVIDEHDYAICQADPSSCATKLKAFWSQISARYAGRYPAAVFELLNEPGGAMTQEFWDGLLAEVLAEIRATNPQRTVIVAAINVEDPRQAGRLVLPPDDRNIIVTVHYYKPFRFTHQGALWSTDLAGLHDIAWGSASDERQVAADLGTVDAWAKATGRPIYLGEFGAYEGAPMASRVRYLGFVTRTAERLGWPWAYWQFDHDFALFDRGRDRWIEPLLRAVMPPKRSRP